MDNLQDINYALISALYSHQESGLYSDVYFPIIKYTIVQLFNKKSLENESVYYTAQDVQDFIEDRFKIHIPTIVLTKSLEKIEKTKKNFVELTLMEQGNSFQIKKVWDAQVFDELAGREEQFTEGLKQIETDYKSFLENNGIIDDGVSYLQFISDNTHEVIGYFQNSDASVIDEKYATIIFFLEYLHKTPSRISEFYIADQLFWASIIAGYLKSEKPLVDAAEEGSVKEYFLDTSILLGLLGLSTSQKERYAKELKEIIMASGGAMKAHPMTLEEIKNILNSVESAGTPDPGTDIAEAWENHHLTINKLAQIRFGLQGLLEKHGVQIFPIIGTDQCHKISASYKGLKVVEELARERSLKSKSYSQDNFREIHDLFMDDYIKERRRAKAIEEDVVFVTANRDLITFTKNRHQGVNYMMSTGRIILDLWMHSAKPANISGCALTETMARCLDQHNQRVRNKIVEVSRFFNENKGNFDAQVYQDFIKKLYRRAKNVIITVESDPDNQDTLNQITIQRIIDAIKADQEYTDKRLDEAEANITSVEERLTKEIREKEDLAEENKAHKDYIEGLEKDKQKLSNQVAEAKKTIKDKDQTIEKESQGRKNAESKVELYEKRDTLKDELKTIEAIIAPLEVLRNKSFSDAKVTWWMVFGVLFILSAITVVIYSIKTKEYRLIAAGAVLVPIGVLLINRFFALKDKKEERRQKAYQKWEDEPENKKYISLVNKKKEIKRSISAIEERLHQ